MFVYIAFVNYLISLYCFNSGGSFIHFIIEIPVLTLGASESSYPETNGFNTSVRVDIVILDYLLNFRSYFNCGRC